MININYNSRNYKGFEIKVLKQKSRYGKNFVTGYVWDIQTNYDQWTRSRDSFYSPEVALKNAQFWIEEFLLKGKNE